MCDEAKTGPSAWRVQSSPEEGMHTVIAPGQRGCLVSCIRRLNLSPGRRYTLETGGQEMCVHLIQGRARLCSPLLGEQAMDKLDSFYLPGNCQAEITGETACVFYLGCAPCEGYGRPRFRKFDPSLPLGDVHQIHGSGVGRREVMFTLTPEDPASRLICGYTWGGQGAWTSWPPHQHEKDLEEVYCYFDMDPPRLGFHVSYLHSGASGQAVAHPVQTGTMVLAPRGYHPTVATPGTQNTYLWVLTAFSHGSRRYDLAVTDPEYPA